MKLRETLQSYLKYAPDLAPRTVRRMGHDVNRFEVCFGTDLDIAGIGPEMFAEFRRWGLERPLSPTSIESNVSTILTILRHARRFKLLVELPDRGRSLRRPPPKIEQPTIDDIQKLYAVAHVAKWPRRIHVTPAIFWRAWIVVSYFTALRLSDMLRLDWSMLSEEDGTLTVDAEKTGKRHEIPIHPVLFAHLKMMHGPLDRIFPVGTSLNQLRRELRRMSEAAGVRYASPQMFRRLAATEWERARHGAGQYIQGSTLRNSSRFYIDTTELLRKALDDLRVPEAFTDGVEIAQRIAEEQRLERISLKEHQFEIPKPPDMSEWGFAPGCACFRGRWFKLTGARWRALRCLVESGQAIGTAELAPVIFEKPVPADPDAVSGRIGVVLSRLRTSLRDAFGLEETFDPIPCVAVHRLDGGGQWTVYLPRAGTANA